MKKTPFLLLITAWIITSCQTPISITLPQSENSKVIEGWIENGKPATVVVSNSISYYSTIDLNDIMGSIDRTATVRVTTEDGLSETLSLGYSLDNILGFVGGAYIGSSIIGQAGKTYYLYVEDTSGNIYTSSTTIPSLPVQIDSMTFAKQKATDTTAFLRFYFTDRAETEDCYRFFMKIFGLDNWFSSISFGTYDDLTFNGKQMTFEAIRTPQTNLLVSGMSDQEQKDFYRMACKIGDTVVLRSTLVDKATLNYWFPLQIDLQMGSNPFLVNGTYPSNIEGENVIGIWSGYHARYDTLIWER